MAAVKGVKDWYDLSVYFGVYISRDQYDSDEAYHKAVVEKFLLGEGRYQPTWRAVIWCLDRVDEIALADKIRNFGEPVQGECTCNCTCQMVVIHVCTCVPVGKPVVIGQLLLKN